VVKLLQGTGSAVTQTVFAGLTVLFQPYRRGLCLQLYFIYCICTI